MCRDACASCVPAQNLVSMRVSSRFHACVVPAHACGVMRTPAEDFMSSPVQSRRPQLRAARRLAARQSQISLWWASMPTPRPDYFSPLALSLALDQNLRRMAAALRALGWQRVIRRVHGRQIALWLPPGSPITPRSRGRPRHDAPSSTPSPDRSQKDSI